MQKLSVSHLLWVPDHLMCAHPKTGEARLAVWECWSVLAALAAATSDIELGTFVACTSFRNPALLAKMADTVDEISGGRLILGLGAGWKEEEFRAFGYPFDHLVGRFEEALQIIIRCCARERSTSRASTTRRASASCCAVVRGKKDRRS